jgi:hypothetical protein
MPGYGYSLWLIPLNWKYIQREFSIDFIPHITIASNLPYIPPNILDNKIYTVTNFQKGQILSGSYPVDPLYGFGYPCKISQIYTTHNPHMTLFYSSNEILEIDTFSKFKEPPPDLQCRIYLVNTNFLNPLEWRVIY